jgi:hypothetical protein
MAVGIFPGPDRELGKSDGFHTRPSYISENSRCQNWRKIENLKKIK